MNSPSGNRSMSNLAAAFVVLLAGSSAFASQEAAQQPENPPASAQEPAAETPAGPAEQTGPQIPWQAGPLTGSLGEIAEVDVPEGFLFTGAEGTRRFLESTGNLTNGAELGTIAPADGPWFVVFEFSDVGYVKDDEKDKLDADAMLESIKAGTEEANKIRRERGWPTLTIVGWEQPPRYDPETKNLEWATRGQSEHGFSINYNVRLLGRKGVMEVSLVVGPDNLQAAMPAFKSLLGGYDYKSGERYAEFKAGDKIAQYGLTALVVGGAAAAALKTGLLQKFWKLILAGVVALGALLKKAFNFFRREESAPTGQV